MTETVDDLIQNFERPPNVEGLGALSELCQQMVAQDALVEHIEKRLKEEKQKLTDLRVGKIPALMVELGLKSLQLADGSEVRIKRSVSCKFFPETRGDALEWLDANGFSDLVKREVGINFDRGQEEKASLAATILAEAGFKPFMVKDVHHSTLSAWGRKQVEGGIDKVPPELFNINFFDMAEVK